MKALLTASALVFLIVPSCLSQEPIPILRSQWKRVMIKAPKPDVTAVGPVTPVSADTKYFQRKARDQRTDNPMDPTTESVEGRSRQMDQAVKESRAAQADDVTGYTYSADIRNDTGSLVNIIFWEYKFTEIARPSNVVRRQFICGMELKNGENKQLVAFSTHGPSDTIDVDSLAKSNEKLFTEEVQVNRIELSDGTIIQRDNWKYSDVKEAVQRATSTPWVNEVCRSL